MKLTLRKSERTLGVRSLVALAVMGSLSLAQVAKADQATAQAELTAQLHLKTKYWSSPTETGAPLKSKPALPADLNNAIAAALKPAAAQTDPYKLTGTATGLNAQAVEDLLVAACGHVADNVLNKDGSLKTSGTGATGVALYVKTIFAAESKIAKADPVNYPQGVLSTVSSVKHLINTAFTSSFGEGAAKWALIAQNASGGKKFTLALTEQLFGPNFQPSTSGSNMQAAMTALVKADKTVGVYVLKTALALTGSNAAADIRHGAFLADKGGVAYLAAAAAAAYPASQADVAADAILVTEGKKATNVNAATLTAAAVSLTGSNAVSAGNALKAALAGAGSSHYVTYTGLLGKPESYNLVPEIVGAATIAKPDYANQIVASALTSGSYTNLAGKPANWAKGSGVKALTAGLQYSDMIKRSGNTIIASGTNFNGAAEASAAVVEQAMYAVQSGTAAGGSGLIQKDVNSLLPTLAASALKTLLKVDVNPGMAKVQVSVNALAGAAAGAVVSVTGTGAADAFQKYATKSKVSPYTGDPTQNLEAYQNTVLWAVVKAVVGTVKKDPAQSVPVLEAMAQAVGYITGFYGDNAHADALKSGIASAALAAGMLSNTVSKTLYTALELQGIVGTAFTAGASGTAGAGAYGTRNIADGGALYGTYWAASSFTAGATGQMVTDITGL